MAIDITPAGDFCVRAAKPENGEGEGTRYEYIGTNIGFTIPKEKSAVEEKSKKSLLRRFLGA